MFSRVANDTAQTQKVLKARAFVSSVTEHVTEIIKQNRKMKHLEIQNEMNKMQDLRLAQLQSLHLDEGGDPADLPVVLPETEKKKLEVYRGQLKNKQKIAVVVGTAVNAWKMMNTISFVKKIVVRK
jgi:hypothetical protein